MDKDKNYLVLPRVCDVDEISLQADFCESISGKDSKPDLRLVTLVKLLARQAAKEQFKLELIASDKAKNKQKTN